MARKWVRLGVRIRGEMEVSSHCSRHHGLQALLLLYPETIAIGFIHSLQNSLDAVFVLRRNKKQFSE
jgi:hypothetical protein